MLLFGLGTTNSGIRNNLTVFFKNKLFVISVIKINKIKFYYYNEEEHKPRVVHFFGYISGINPDKDESNKY